MRILVNPTPKPLGRGKGGTKDEAVEVTFGNKVYFLLTT